MLAEGLPARVRAPPKSADARGGCEAVPTLKEAPPELKERTDEQGLRSLTDGARPAGGLSSVAGGRSAVAVRPRGGRVRPGRGCPRSRRVGVGGPGVRPAATLGTERPRGHGASRSEPGLFAVAEAAPVSRVGGGRASVPSAGLRGRPRRSAHSAEAVCPPRLPGALPAGQRLQGRRRSAVGAGRAGGPGPAPPVRALPQTKERAGAPPWESETAPPVALRDQLPRLAAAAA